MSAILALSALNYINMKNNALSNMISINNARMGLLANPYTSIDNFASSPDVFCNMDAQMEIDMLTNNLQYLYAKAMLEQIKKQQKEDAKHFSIFA